MSFQGKFGFYGFEFFLDVKKASTEGQKSLSLIGFWIENLPQEWNGVGFGTQNVIFFYLAVVLQELQASVHICEDFDEELCSGQVVGIESLH